MVFSTPAQPAWIGAAGRLRTEDHPPDATGTSTLAGRTARFSRSGWPRCRPRAVGQTCPAPPDRDAPAAALTLSGQPGRCCSQRTRSPRLMSHFLLYYYYFFYASEEMLSLTRPVFHSNWFPEVKRIVSAGVSVSHTSLTSSGRKQYLEQTSS